MRVDVAQAAAALLRKARALELEAKAAEKASGRETLTIARALSSGPLSQEQLTLMGHPYSRRDPRPPFSASIINVQSGRFRASWRLRGPQETGRGIRSTIVNDSPEAAYLSEQGTLRMIGRPIVRAIAQRVRRLREKRLAAGVARGLEE